MRGRFIGVLPRPTDLGKKVHEASMECHLLRGVIMRLIGGSQAWLRSRRKRIDRAFAVGGVRCVRIVRKKRRAQPVHHGSARRPDKLRLARRILRVRIRAEVVIERDIFREDYDQVLDRRSGDLRTALCMNCLHAGEGHETEKCSSYSRQDFILE